MDKLKNNIKGLTSKEVKHLQEVYGKNVLLAVKKETFFKKMLHVLTEPMFLLLIIAAIIYFFLGEPRDGITMFVFVIGMISIDVIQEWKTDKTLEALKELSAPKIEVIRDEEITEINSEDLVPGDLMLIYEGTKIPADGSVLKCSGLRVDEATLTGEAEGVWKYSINEGNVTTDYWKNDYCYAGTMVIQGNAMVLVDKIGSKTEYGKIGTNIINAKEDDTPLQKQISTLIKMFAWIAFVLLLMVAIITFLNLIDHTLKDRIIESILSGITLAMAMIPEEFPVILTVFLSMGAWRLAKKNSLIKKLASVETLGSVSVLCVDKTGTITKNEMAVEEEWLIKDTKDDFYNTLALASTFESHDPMEKAILNYCYEHGIDENNIFSGAKIKEYVFTNDTKMMGYVWNNSNYITLTAKGSPESIMAISILTDEEKELVNSKIKEMSDKGLRVIGIAKKIFTDNDNIPNLLTDNELIFCGLIGLIDPPRDNIDKDIALCNKAGIRVVMITGDNGFTASAIAKKIGIPNNDKIITGHMLDELSDEELCEKVKDVSIFSRVIPEHKMRIIKAFRQNGEIVAMTGDGVNDAPALKYADIGIAMGKRGSDVSKEAASLILMDDNFSTIVDTIKDGRRIYNNIKKAVYYVLIIHIPIALASLLSPLLKISPANLFLLPIHIVLLELIIDPTCSVILERQPVEGNIMHRPPRDPNEKLINTKSLFRSIIQGLIIFAFSYILYYQNIDNNIYIARSMGLSMIMFANLFLVMVNSSETDYAYTTIKKLINDKIMWLVCMIMLLGIVVILYSPINTYLKLTSLTINQLLLTIGIAFISVFWYEVVKLIKNYRSKK